MKLPRDIEAEIYFPLTKDGGRSTCVLLGYSPQFCYNGNICDAYLEYPDLAAVNPGGTVRAYIGFASPRTHVGRVRVGLDFEIHEDARLVGKGVVTRILELKRSACRASKLMEKIL
jgi:translation elongation factor EF-Tu-like GTPase